jgi:hypothetical protein
MSTQTQTYPEFVVVAERTEAERQAIIDAAWTRANKAHDKLVAQGEGDWAADYWAYLLESRLAEHGISCADGFPSPSWAR